MKFKKSYISASLVMYFIKLGQLAEDQKDFPNKKVKYVKDVIPESFHEEFMFVVQNVRKKDFGGNVEWFNFIKNMNLSDSLKREDLEESVNDFTTEVIFLDYKLYETNNDVNEFIRE